MAIYGIKAVKYCLSKNLLHYVEADEGGGHTRDIEVFNPATGQCTVTNPLTVLPCLVGSKATLTVDDAVVNRRHQYTARLTFVTADNPNLDGEYYAFVVETNEGEQLLLGSKVAPRCSVTTRQNVAATAGDINGYTTTVDFKAPYAPLRLPVTTEPVTDTREFDICCGAIAQPQQPDTREFDVCCGQIAQPPVPDTREFDVCCGEIDYNGYVPPEPPDPDYQHINPNIPTRAMKLITAEEEPGLFQNRWAYSCDLLIFGRITNTGGNVTQGNHWDPDWKYFEIVKDIPGTTALENCSYNVMIPESFDEADVDLNKSQMIYKQEDPTVPVGFKPKNATVPTLSELTAYFNVKSVSGGPSLAQRQWWVLLSFDGHTKIVTKLGLNTLNDSAQFMAQRPCYVKVILYGSDADYAGYYVLPLNYENYTPIYSGIVTDQVIGFYTED